MKVIGLMSGTSSDGVDAALVDIRGSGEALHVTEKAFCTLPYPRRLQQRLVAAATGGTVTDICHLNAVLGEWFAQAALRVIKEAGLRPAAVDLIGSHGQTVQHLPTPRREPGLGPLRSTLQIAEASVIAERTGITTVADFRSRDVAAGGEGAPLAPYVHYLLLRHPHRSRLIVNLGGISNVTYLPAGGDLKAVLAFDTGPGNMMLDGLARHLSHGRLAMDRDGRLAAQGHVDERLLASLLRHPFIWKRPPKSTGREEFGDTILRRVLAAKGRHSLADLLATCSLFAALGVQSALQWLKGDVEEVIVGGGGVRNRTLMDNLAIVFEPTPVRTFEEVGWRSKTFEAVAFAVLAYQTAHGECGNVPAVTGAAHPAILGKIVPAGAHWRTKFR
jgi:anhydro-N-acetylmuramic acid kinase